MKSNTYHINWLQLEIFMVRWKASIYIPIQFILHMRKGFTRRKIQLRRQSNEQIANQLKPLIYGLIFMELFGEPLRIFRDLILIFWQSLKTFFFELLGIRVLKKTQLP